MTALAFLQHLRALRLSYVKTNEAAAVLNISIHSAGKYLEALRLQGFVERLLRGKWVLNDPPADVLACAEFIVAPEESYISLHTALFHHGMIEQVPTRIYSVTTARSRVVKSPLGIYSFHHCQAEFFCGFDYLKPFLKLASAEKALVDYFYFTPGRSRQFTRLPELEIPSRFSWNKAWAFSNSITSPRTRGLVQSRLSEVRDRSR